MTPDSRDAVPAAPTDSVDTRKARQATGDAPRRRYTAVVLALLGGALALFALAAPSMRDGEDFLSGRAMFPFAIGITLLLASRVGRSLERPMWWGVLFIAGQAASLQLVDAGITLHYQHYLPWSRLVTSDRAVAIPLAIVAVQAALVIAGFVRFAPVVTGWIRTSLGIWRAVALLALLVLTSATLSEDVQTYVRELLTSSAIQLVALGNLVVLVAAIPGATLDRIESWATRVLGAQAEGGSPAPADAPRGPDGLTVVCGVLVTVVCALLAFFIYERHPHVQDEVKYLYQARYLASGMLAMPPPPVPEAFRMYLMDVGPRGWYSVVPPGWPAVLAVGVKLGAPWLVNPVLSGINVVLAGMLLRRLYDVRTARIATLLLALSPMHIFLGMSYMAHAMTFTCALLAALAVDRVRRTNEWWPTWLGGMLLGVAAIARQLDGLIFAVGLGLWAVGFGGRRIRLGATVGLVLGSVIGVAPVLPWNAYFTGHATTFPIMEYHDRLVGENVNAYGFGPERGMGWGLDPNPGHSPLDATINANLNTTALSVELLGWATGSLLLVYFLVLRGRLSRSDRAMLVVIALTFVAYFFNYFSGGPDFGARYWFPMLLPLYALVARGLQRLGKSLDVSAAAPVRSDRGHRGPARALAAGAILSLSASLAFIPWRMFDKYHHYLGARPDIGAIAAAHQFGRSLVLVRGAEHPGYTSAATYNPLDLHADAPIYAHDVGPAARAGLARAFPDRPVWILDGPSPEGAPFRVLAGPMPASRLLEPVDPAGGPGGAP